MLSLGLCGRVAVRGYLSVSGGEIPETLRGLVEPPSSNGPMQELGERTEGEVCANGPDFPPLPVSFVV